MDDELFSEAINRLKQRELWFTTKNDPTWGEAPEYYKLDEYGDPTEEEQKQIIEEINDYVGDGAINTSDAIDMWINESINNFKIGLVDYLKTQFKAKPVVNQIEAFETPAPVDVVPPVELKENKEIKTEEFDDSYDEEEFNSFKITNGDKTYTIRRTDDNKWVDDDGNKYMGYLIPQDILHYYNGFHIITENKKIIEALSMEQLYNLANQSNNTFQLAGVVHAMGYVDGGVANILQNQFSSMKKQGTDFNNMKDKILDTINANIINDTERLTASKEIKTEGKEYNKIDLKNILDNGNVIKATGKETFTPGYFYVDADDKVYVRSKDVTWGWEPHPTMNYTDLLNHLENLQKDGFIIEITDEKPPVIKKEDKEIKTEDAKRRLKEENNKSQNIITDMINAPDFDKDSNQGKIVLRTSGLFNMLSDKGFDVQVTFDNGESQSVILLGQQGGKVIMTITGAENPIGIFVSGNYPLSTEIIQKLTDVLDVVQNTTATQDIIKD